MNKHLSIVAAIVLFLAGFVPGMIATAADRPNIIIHIPGCATGL